MFYTGEKVTQVNAIEVTFQKTEGVVKVSANTPLKIKGIPRSRTFNMELGVEAVSIVAFFGKSHKIIIKLEVV